jgi:hypothetical protein
MSIRGKFRKQPVEVEVYSIQFVEDLAETDEITTSFTILARDTAAAWDQVVQSAPYTTLASDDGRVIVSTASVTGYASAPDGYLLYASNKSQNAAITVCGFSVPARGAIAVRRYGAAWVTECSTTSVMVNSTGDQRVRTFVSGGLVNTAYKVQVAVTTTEGRTLQEEFKVTVKEV